MAGRGGQAVVLEEDGSRWRGACSCENTKPRKVSPVTWVSRLPVAVINLLESQRKIVFSLADIRQYRIFLRTYFGICRHVLLYLYIHTHARTHTILHDCKGTCIVANYSSCIFNLWFTKGSTYIWKFCLFFPFLSFPPPLGSLLNDIILVKLKYARCRCSQKLFQDLC